MKSSRVQGFTLIELLIVLAVLGLLSAYAMSLYRDYVRRTHVGEGIQLATAARNALGETHGIYGIYIKMWLAAIILPTPLPIPESLPAMPSIQLQLVKPIPMRL